MSLKVKKKDNQVFRTKILFVNIESKFSISIFFNCLFKYIKAALQEIKPLLSVNFLTTCSLYRLQVDNFNRVLEP